MNTALTIVGVIVVLYFVLGGRAAKCEHCKKRKLTTEGMANGDAELFGLPLRVKCLNCGKESTI